MRPLRRLWCQATCALVGVRAIQEGRPFLDCPTVFVANHVSYRDIVVLGGLIDVTFVAKAEVAGWPLFGTLARITGTFFVRRHWRPALVQRNALAARIGAAESFILFGEGTSTNGLAVCRFKTSLLGVAESWVLDGPSVIQAVTLAHVRLADGTPVSAANGDLYAWHGDVALLPHRREVLQQDGIENRVILHEPVLSWSVTSRKPLGLHLRDQMALALQRGLTKRRLKPSWARVKKKRRLAPPCQIGPACVGLRLVMTGILIL